MAQRKPSNNRRSDKNVTVTTLIGWLGKGFEFVTLPFRRGGAYLVTLALALLTLSLLINFGSQVLLSTRLEARRLALATEVADLEAENRQLEGAVQFAESDANVERVAREQLGYTREGDVVVLPQFPLPTPTPAPLPAQESVVVIGEPNWQSWWYAFFPVETQ